MSFLCILIHVKAMLVGMADGLDLCYASLLARSVGITGIAEFYISFGSASSSCPLTFAHLANVSYISHHQI